MYCTYPHPKCFFGSVAPFAHAFRPNASAAGCSRLAFGGFGLITIRATGDWGYTGRAGQLPYVLALLWGCSDTDDDDDNDDHHHHQQQHPCRMVAGKRCVLV